MADALISVVLEQLASYVQEEVELVVGVRKEVLKLTATLKLIQGVVADAERKQVRDDSVKAWLEELKNIFYSADDVLDEWHTKTVMDQDQLHENTHRSNKKFLERTFKLDLDARSEYFLADDRLLEAIRFLDLGADAGASWELLQAMVNPDYRKRPTAEVVLNHRFMTGAVLLVLQNLEWFEEIDFNKRDPFFSGAPSLMPLSMCTQKCMDAAYIYQIGYFVSLFKFTGQIVMCLTMGYAAEFSSVLTSITVFKWIRLQI